MTIELPTSDDDLITTTRQQWEQAARTGDSSQAGCSYCWALVHSRSEKDVKQGLGWAETLLADPHLPQSRQHECCYYIAVAKYKLGKHIEARNQLRTLLQADPDMRQARSLLEELEQTISRDALVGLGIGATGLLGIGALVIGGLLAGRR